MRKDVATASALLVAENWIRREGGKAGSLEGWKAKGLE
jgi:hypothetical protein